MQVADFYEGYKLILGTKRRIEGLSLRATDATWSNGSGPEAAGTMLVLIQAMTGRKAVLTELEGPGVEVLQGRRVLLDLERVGRWCGPFTPVLSHDHGHCTRARPVAMIPA